MSAATILRTVLERGRDALPGAWRHDPVFRVAAIGVGVTGVLLLLRLTGPQLPELQAPAYSPSRVVMPVPSPNRPTEPASSQVAAPPEMPKIAPGHSLNDVTVAPAVDGDRFGTFKPGTRP